MVIIHHIGYIYIISRHCSSLLLVLSPLSTCNLSEKIPTERRAVRTSKDEKYKKTDIFIKYNIFSIQYKNLNENIHQTLEIKHFFENFAFLVKITKNHEKRQKYLKNPFSDVWRVFQLKILLFDRKYIIFCENIYFLVICCHCSSLLLVLLVVSQQQESGRKWREDEQPWRVMTRNHVFSYTIRYFLSNKKNFTQKTRQTSKNEHFSYSYEFRSI